MSTVTCVAPVNVAVIKYWGKRNEKLILPVNDSISGSFDTDQLCAKTTVMVSPNFKEDCIWLNGQKQDINNPRLQNCLTEIKKRAGNSNKQMNQWKIHICSENNFPTAAGLASSAAGYACLVVALAKLYKVEGNITAIARVGSGSACRSVMGGFVRWYMGSEPNGSDSIAKQIIPASYWPEMRILILVVNDEKKKIPSAIGMKRTNDTSALQQERVKCVPERANKIEQAIIGKDFKTFAEITMKDSNQMHAACLDAYPPCVYMNDTSHTVVDFIHSFNDAVNDVKVAYTFDAGPNATLYLLEKDVPVFTGVLDHLFPPVQDTLVEYRRGLPIETIKPSETLLNKINIEKQVPGCFKYIIYTRIGEGPKFLENPKNHLLNDQGWPINHS